MRKSSKHAQAAMANLTVTRSEAAPKRACASARLNALLAPAIFAAFVLLPGAAAACGAVEAADASPLMLLLSRIFFGLISVLIVATPVSAILMALTWGARTAWKAVSGGNPPLGFFSVSSFFASLALGVFATFAIPQFARLFESFGPNLPTATRLMLEFNYLLWIPAILSLVLLGVWRGSPRRERYFAAFLAGAVGLAAFTLWALYAPITPMC